MITEAEAVPGLGALAKACLFHGIAAGRPIHFIDLSLRFKRLLGVPPEPLQVDRSGLGCWSWSYANLRWMPIEYDNHHGGQGWAEVHRRTGEVMTLHLVRALFSISEARCGSPRRLITPDPRSGMTGPLGESDVDEKHRSYNDGDAPALRSFTKSASHDNRSQRNVPRIKAWRVSTMQAARSLSTADCQIPQEKCAGVATNLECLLGNWRLCNATIYGCVVQCDGVLFLCIPLLAESINSGLRRGRVVTGKYSPG